jgi:GxxExxY protein
MCGKFSYFYFYENNNVLYNEITHKIIGCAMKVHTTIGNGFQEMIYQRALAIEMGKQGLSFLREMYMTIYYENFDIGTRRVDFFVENNIMVEIKAIITLNDQNINQCRNYLEAYNLPVGLLLNFGSPSLEYKRIYNTKNIQMQNCRKYKNQKKHSLNLPANPPIL